eukprot:1148444-Pelagomonas_calceolata.AAC.2
MLVLFSLKSAAEVVVAEWFENASNDPVLGCTVYEGVVELWGCSAYERHMLDGMRSHLLRTLLFMIRLTQFVQVFASGHSWHLNGSLSELSSIRPVREHSSLRHESMISPPLPAACIQAVSAASQAVSWMGSANYVLGMQQSADGASLRQENTQSGGTLDAASCSSNGGNITAGRSLWKADAGSMCSPDGQAPLGDMWAVRTTASQPTDVQSSNLHFASYPHHHHYQQQQQQQQQQER